MYHGSTICNHSTIEKHIFTTILLYFVKHEGSFFMKSSESEFCIKLGPLYHGTSVLYSSVLLGDSSSRLYRLLTV